MDRTEYQQNLYRLLRRITREMERNERKTRQALSAKELDYIMLRGLELQDIKGFIWLQDADWLEAHGNDGIEALEMQWRKAN